MNKHTVKAINGASFPFKFVKDSNMSNFILINFKPGTLKIQTNTIHPSKKNTNITKLPFCKILDPPPLITCVDNSQNWTPAKFWLPFQQFAEHQRILNARFVFYDSPTQEKPSMPGIYSQKQMGM